MTSKSHPSVMHTIDIQLSNKLGTLDRHVTGGILFFWDDDPYTVFLSIVNPVDPNREMTEWVLSREVLTAVVRDDFDPALLNCGTLQGDIHIQLDRVSDAVVVELTSPSGYAVLWLRLDQVRTWLDATYARVAEGTEGDHIDWDLAYAQLVEQEH